MLDSEGFRGLKGIYGFRVLRVLGHVPQDVVAHRVSRPLREHRRHLMVARDTEGHHGVVEGHVQPALGDVDQVAAKLLLPVPREVVDDADGAGAREHDAIIGQHLPGPGSRIPLLT